MQFSLICLITLFIVTEFEYFSTVFVYDFSVLSCDFAFVNDCDFPDLFFHICSNYRDLGGCCFRGLV